jgi:UDP-N-acetylmuramyl pentapeptide phosphotransferase/UDP-N-acetylglucosamine-1-phosphate transferase
LGLGDLGVTDLLSHGLSSGLVGLAIAYVVAAALTPVGIRVATRLRILDLPVGDKIHAKATPLLGGVPMALTFIVIAAFFPSLERPWQNHALGGLLAGCLAATILGVVDDKLRLKPLWHLLGQICVVAVAIAAGFPVVSEISNPLVPVSGTSVASVNLASAIGPTLALLAGSLFTVFWLVGMMNTVNFLDGLDGLAGGVCAIAALFLCLWAVVVVREGYPPTHDNQNVVLPLILCGAISGFLVFNWAPARVFMGDSGSMFLGFTVGALSIFGPVKLGTAMLVLVVPVVDVAWAIARRVLSRRSFMAGDKQHIYHRLLHLGWSRRQVVLTFYAATIVLGLLDLEFVKVQKLIVLSIVAVGAIALAVLVEVRGRAAQAKLLADDRPAGV